MLSRAAFSAAVAGVLGWSMPLARASEEGQWLANRVDAATYQFYLDTVLCANAGCDRGVGGWSHDPARDQIFAEFDRLGLTVELHQFWYSGTDGFNVVATKTGAVLPGAQYIVGAHYDSANNPGADDDASGVAGLLELARAVSPLEFDATIKFIAFDMEEWGLIGSDAYVTDHLADDIRGMIQLDMIAYNDGADTVWIYGRPASIAIRRAARAALRQYSGLSVSMQGPLDASDHAPFEWAGFKACLLIESGVWNNPCYHTPCDAVETQNYIDYAYAADFTRAVAGYLADHATVHLCLGDLDGDNRVNLTDLALVLAHFSDPGPDSPGDADGDGDTDLTDLALVLTRFGGSCN